MGLSTELTPQQLFDYKQNWRPNAYCVRIHSDLADRAKWWCRKNLERSQWSMDTWTDVYEHTFLFKDDMDKEAFTEEFKKWCNLPPPGPDYY